MLSLDVVQLIQIFLLSKINPSPNLSHTARSFTRLNSVSSVQLVSSRRGKNVDTIDLLEKNNKFLPLGGKVRMRG